MKQASKHANYVYQLEKHQQKGGIQPNFLYIPISAYDESIIGVQMQYRCDHGKANHFCPHVNIGHKLLVQGQI